MRANQQTDKLRQKVGPPSTIHKGRSRPYGWVRRMCLVADYRILKDAWGLYTRAVRLMHQPELPFGHPQDDCKVVPAPNR